MPDTPPSRADQIGLKLTGIVGSMPFVAAASAVMFAWIVYNVYAPRLHGRAFDPPPSFFLLELATSIYGILAPSLIMVGQNAQARRDAEQILLDRRTNALAEKESAMTIRMVRRIEMMQERQLKHIGCELTDAELREIEGEGAEGERMAAMEPCAA